MWTTELACGCLEALRSWWMHCYVFLELHSTILSIEEFTCGSRGTQTLVFDSGSVCNCMHAHTLLTSLAAMTTSLLQQKGKTPNIKKHHDFYLLYSIMHYNQMQINDFLKRITVK